MGSIDINIGSQALEGELSRIADRLPSALTNLLDDLAADVEVLMKDEAPVRLGDLQNSITTDDVSNLERLIWPTIEYAPYVILGHMTRPITVHTRHYGSLSYGGNQHFVPGNPFPDRAADRADPYLEKRMESFYNDLLE